MTAYARRVDYEDGGFSVWTWCPGCDSLHPFAVEDPSSRINRGVTWEWDGDLERPTFSPSLLVHTSVHLCEGEHPPAPCVDPACGAPGHMVLHDPRTGDPEDRVLGHPTPHTRDPAYGPCHSFLRAGRWEFLPDSAHRLAGRTVDMVPLPPAWAGDGEGAP